LLRSGRVNGLEHSCTPPRVFGTRRSCNLLLFLRVGVDKPLLIVGGLVALTFGFLVITSLCRSSTLGCALTVLVVGFLAARLAALVGVLVVHRFRMRTVHLV
jgi:hypothetical protein